MAGTSGPLGTSGSDMVGGPGRNWGCLAGEGRTGEGRRREAGAGAGFSCCCRCRTPELSLQTGKRVRECVCEKAVGRPPPGLPLWGAGWGRKGKPPETKRQTEMTETGGESRQRGRAEQEEAAQTQSWAFLGWDSNSRDSNASREQRAPGLGDRGISSSSAWQVLKAPRTPAPPFLGQARPAAPTPRPAPRLTSRPRPTSWAGGPAA